MPECKQSPRIGRVGLVMTGLLLLAACSGGGGSPVPSGANCLAADANNAVELHAKDISFTNAPCISAMAGRAIVIHFTNDDNMPHDVVVYSDSSKSSQLAKGDIITGPNKSETVTVPAQEPGQLYFECSVHPGQMNGALVVNPAGASASP